MKIGFLMRDHGKARQQSVMPAIVQILMDRELPWGARWPGAGGNPPAMGTAAACSRAWIASTGPEATTKDDVT